MPLILQKTFQSTSSVTSFYNERTVDILSALELSKLSLIGSPNIKRILLARLSLTMADPKQLFQAEQLNKICRLFVSIERLIDLSDTFQTLTSESYIYWHHDVIIPIYLHHVIQVNETDDCENMQVIFFLEMFWWYFFYVLVESCMNIEHYTPKK